jgi:ribosomal protein S18 acetylase RimI-like enzyme
VGAFLALHGAEVHKRRSIDTLYVMKDCKPERRTLLKQLLTPFAAAHEPLGDDEFYLRSLAVDEGQRGRGFARALLQRFLDDGAAAGYRRFRLEVAADNRPALALYQRMGFTTFREAEIAGFGWSTCLMRLEK